MSGKSKEEIAFELVSKLKGVGVWGENNMSSILDMYAECLEATSGVRAIPGRKPVAQAPQVQAPAQSQAPTPAPAQPTLQSQGQPQRQPVTPPQQPAVRQQQNMIQQAYQQPVPQGR